MKINESLSTKILDHMKIRLRISDSVYDDEIKSLITAALVDMETSGINTANVMNREEGALILEACVLYVKAYFGLDNAERESYEFSYQKLISHMRNNPTDFEQR